MVMEFELVGGSHDGEKVDIVVDRFGHTLTHLYMVRKCSSIDLERFSDRVARHEVYIKTPIGVNDDGSVKYVFTIQ